MSNYTKENLIAISPTAVPSGTLAIKVGDEIFTPGNIHISSGGGEYYKCAAVDTVSKTWSGYLAVLVDGVYTFEETLTEGLSYGSAYTPGLNSIYNADATVKIDKLWNGSRIPIDGLVFHAPLDSLSVTATTGQTLEFIGNMPSIATVDGIQCLAFNNSVILTPQTSDMPSGSFPFSLCIALYVISKFEGVDAEQGVLNLGDYNAKYYDAGISCYSKGNEIRGGNYWERTLRENISDEELLNRWIPCVLTSDGSTFSLYIDGEFAVSDTANSITPSAIRIGGFENSYERFTGYLSDARIYNRVLSQEEIAAIADQFKG